MRILLVLAMAGSLAGCVTAAERQAREDATDEQKCRSYGANPGTQAYIQCRLTLGNQRTTLRAAAIAADQSVICNKVGTATICN